jgi:hypothetical protein
MHFAGGNDSYCILFRIKEKSNSQSAVKITEKDIIK